jgi:hypothetical protein
MSETDEITIGFEGQRRDLSDFAFDIFDQELSLGREKEAPGGTIMIRDMPLAKSALGHAIIEIALFTGKNVAVPVLVAWLCSKWKRQGKKPISVKIENKFYQFDAPLLTKAIEDAIAKQKKKKR